MKKQIGLTLVVMLGLVLIASALTTIYKQQAFAQTVTICAERLPDGQVIIIPCSTGVPGAHGANGAPGTNGAAGGAGGAGGVGTNGASGTTSIGGGGAGGSGAGR
jgi:hypothetical protein